MTSFQKKIRARGKPAKSKVLQGFFKTGPGEYGEGDVFLGITVPDCRKLAKSIADQSWKPIAESLLRSRFHEERLIGLLTLLNAYKKASDSEKTKIYQFYIKKFKRINNWDLVDLTAPGVVGAYLYDLAPKEKKQLAKWARSNHLWTRRIAILATFRFIRHEEYDWTLKISEVLRDDPHDLIHKAVGWMLREVGKKDLAVEERFLKRHYRKMPRTMLRYAIERFPEKKRKAYLLGTI